MSIRSINARKDSSLERYSGLRGKALSLMRMARYGLRRTVVSSLGLAGALSRLLVLHR